MIGTKSKLTVDNTENKVVLIDADSLLYFSGYGSEEDQIFSETKLSEKIYDILNIVGNSYNIEKYYIFVKGKNNFRYKIFPAYKKNRPPKHPIIDVLTKYLIDVFQAIESHNAESDDYVFTYSQLPEYKDRSIICSVDKDLLQIPGIHYDYQKNKFHIIKEEEAKYRLAIQMIMGDAADGIQGLKGYGPKKAEKLLKQGMTNFQYIKSILKEYQKNCSTLQQAKEEVRLNYKLLKLQKVNVKTEANLTI
jgi:DNA polymerase-1